MTSGKAIGDMGEKAARTYLEDLGYRMMDTNYRNRQGEMDLVAYDGNVLAFIEVKTRRSARYGTPGEAVDRNKQRRLSRIALMYLAEKRMLCSQVRFDVVEVLIEGKGIKQIRLIKDAFQPAGNP